MRKVIVLLLALSLSGCITIQEALNIGHVATASISNPVTKDMLNDVENGAILVFAGLGAYKRSCIAGAIPAGCRNAIRKTQVYTRKLPSLLSSLRRFVRTNDQINAIVVYNTIKQMISDVRTVAIANNIQVQ